LAVTASRLSIIKNTSDKFEIEVMPDLNQVDTIIKTYKIEKVE